MLIDEVKIVIKSGNGGNGLAHLYSDGSRPKGGPDGGKGGDVIFEASSDLNTLINLRFKPELAAENGVTQAVIHGSFANTRFVNSPDGGFYRLFYIEAVEEI